MIIKKEVKTVSQNCAGYGWRINDKTFQMRLEAILERIKKEDPDIIGLQETYASPKYMNLIKEFFPENDYIVVIPNTFDPIKNKKSVISIMIFKKQGLRFWKQIELPDLHDISMRYNYVEAEYDFGKIRPLNVWMPQTAANGGRAEWFCEKRDFLKNTFIETVQDEADLWRESDQLFIPFGDFNLTSESMEDLAVGQLVESLRPEDKGASTWHNAEFGPGKDLDHIFYGSKYCSPVAYKFTRIDYSPIREGISDHAMLIGSVCLVE